MGKRIITKDKGINKDKRIIKDKGINKDKRIIKDKGIKDKGINKSKCDRAQLHLNKKNQFTDDDNFPIQVPSKFRLGWAKKNIHILDEALNPKDREAIRKDQAVRAKTIVKYMQQESLSDILLLDGPGRMTARIIDELHKADINPDITLVEKEITTHEYHKQYLPSSIEKINGDIMTYRRFSNNTMVYLNFCSIGTIVDEIGSVKFIKYLKKIRHLMIGFSVRGTTKKGKKSITGQKKKNTELSKVLKYIDTEYAFVSERKQYKTYISRSRN